MECGKNLSSCERQDTEKAKFEKNSKSAENENANECGFGYGFQGKGKNFKPSMIPVMKTEKNETKSILCKKRPASSSKLLISKTEREKEDFDYKLKILKEKEKSIEEYYLKIEEMIQKFVAQKKEDGNKKSFNFRTSENSAAKKMTSDPLVFGKNRLKSCISDFENNIQQISQIWLKTTADLSSTLRNLKNNPSVDPVELQMENIRIQLAIKQAKSLTLIKTRNVIAEAKKLFRNREIIRTELQSLLNQEILKTELNKSQKTLGDKHRTSDQQNVEEQGMNGNGDSIKETETENFQNNKETFDDKYSKNERQERMEKKASARPTTKHIRENDYSEEKEKESSSDGTSKERSKLDGSSFNSEKIILEMEILKKELLKKNKTITNLNKKIFDLQKTCNENSVKYNQLQVKMFEFHEKSQWNQVLWKQIGKLKERIKSLQQNNKELEFQKKELESKITRRDQEIDRLIKLNHILNQRKHLLNTQDVTVLECRGRECRSGEAQTETIHEKCFDKENKMFFDEKALEEKQATINQLKKILNLMKDQENFAQKQIYLFQSKIEELEKNGKI